MADFTRLAGTGTWANTALWLGGTAPSSGTGNGVYFADGYHEITDGGLIASGVDVNKLVIPSTATVNLRGGTLGIDVSNGTAPTLIVYAVGQNNEIRLSGTFDIAQVYGPGPVSLSGSAPDLTVWQGSNVVINSDCAATTIYAYKPQLLYVRNHASDRIDTLEHVGGNIITARSLENTVMSEGAALTLEGTANLTNGSSGGTFAIRDSNSRLIILSEDLTIDATGKLYAGKIDTSRLRRKATWTTVTRTPACDINVGGGTGQVTITTDTMKGNETLAEFTP